MGQAWLRHEDEHESCHTHVRQRTDRVTKADKGDPQRSLR
jgi:hypothetical protein